MEMTEAVEHFPGGPIDPTILKSFESHIAHTIWTSVEDDRGPLKCISHWSKLNDWNLEEECAAVRTRVRESGLLNLAKYSYKHIDRVLVSAFIERWHPETNSFHLPFGEMTITLDDVRHILDIPVDGVPVYGELGASNMAFEVALDLVCRGLGVSKAQAQTEMEKAFAIKLSWIKSVCSGTTENSTPERHDQCARGYLLYLLGCTVFPDKTGNKISAYYLQSLMDLDGVHNLAWGMGVLAHLYRQMGLATRSGVRQISGNLTLLQAWIFEHFSLGRPIPNRDYNEKMPRMRRWHIQLSPRDTDSTLVSIREQLDDLSPNEVCWDPYINRRKSYPFHEVAYFNGVLVCFDIAEPYYPGRVLRQFGRVQTIPKAPMKAHKDERGITSSRYRVTYDISTWIQENWQNHLLAESSRSVPVKEPWDCTHDYLPWFYKITHPYVQNPVNRLTPVRKVPVSLATRGEEVPSVISRMKHKIHKAVQLLRASVTAGLEQDLSTVLSRDRQVYRILEGVLEDILEEEVGACDFTDFVTEAATGDEDLLDEEGSQRKKLKAIPTPRTKKILKRKNSEAGMSVI